MKRNEGSPIDLLDSVDVDHCHTGFLIIKGNIVSGPVQRFWRLFNKSLLVHDSESEPWDWQSMVPF